MGSFFSSEELAGMSAGLCPAAPKDYKLPTHFPSLANASRISIDAECKDPKLPSHGNGVYRQDGKIVGWSVAAWDKVGKLFHAEYLPIGHRNGPNLEADNVHRYLADNLNFFEGELCGTNLMYDGDWGQSVGITPMHAKWRDIQWAEPLIDEMARNYRLETLAQKYLGFGKFTNHFAFAYGPDYIKRFDEVHPGHAREYGLGDVLLPSLILDAQYKELASLGMIDLYNLESRLTPFLLYLRRQGVRIDMERAMRFKHALEDKRRAKLIRLSSSTGVQFTEENFGSSELLAYTFRKLDIKVPTTAKGQMSITDKWLHHLCTCQMPDPKDLTKMIDNPHCGHPGRLLECANRYDKAISTFIDGYVFDYAVDGRLHCMFHPLRKSDGDGENGTESGRLSSSDPNLQNIPTRDDEIGPMCRSMFVPEIGARWYSLDYSQIEYRMLVHMAVEKKCKGAEVAQKMYRDVPDIDFHQGLADITGLKRSDAKNLNFGLCYGMGIQKLAATLKMLDAQGKPTDAAKQLMDKYHGAAPFIRALYDKCMHDAETTGEIRTILNRRSQFEFWEPAYTAKGGKRADSLPYYEAISAYGFDIKRCLTHKALNRLLQGSAADLIKKAMVDAWEAGVWSSNTDLTASISVHDELDGSVFPTKRGKEAHAELKHIMESCLPLHVPVLVSGDSGGDWSEAK